MERSGFERIIKVWRNGIPNREYDETCSFWAPDGEFTVYQAAGNPSEWGGKIVRTGPGGARELFSDFHDKCVTTVYEVHSITIDTLNRSAAWQVRFEGERGNEKIRQELVFMVKLNEAGKIAHAFIWPGNP